MRVLTFDELREVISERLSNSHGIVVCAVGNDLRGDDGVGLDVGKQLKDMALPEKVSVILCGELPENYIHDIIAHDPTHVILIDGANVGTSPGEIVMVETDETYGQSISTHRLPLSFLTRMIKRRLERHVDVFILGVQVENCSLGHGLSLPVRRAASHLVNALRASMMQ